MVKNYLIILLVIICGGMNSCNQNKPLTARSSEYVEVDSLPGSAPYLTKADKGNIVLSWIRNINDSTAMLCYAKSLDAGQHFGEPVSIAPSMNIQAHSENLPKVIFKPSGEIMAIWAVGNS